MNPAHNIERISTMLKALTTFAVDSSAPDMLLSGVNCALALAVIHWGVSTWVPWVLRHYRETYFAFEVPESPALRRPSWQKGAALTALLATLAALAAGAEPGASRTLPYLAFLCLALIGVALYGIVRADRLFQVIPDRFQLAGAVGSLGVLSARSPDLAAAAMHAAWGLAIACGLYAVGRLYERLRGRSAMGLGDIKLVAWLGLLVGPETLWVLYYALLIGALISLPLWLAGRRRLDSSFAFAPYLVFGLLLHGATHSDRYLQMAQTLLEGHFG